jgi:hypothetical protein
MLDIKSYLVVGFNKAQVFIVPAFIDVFTGLKKNENTAVEIYSADHATPSINKKSALTSPTIGGRSVGIVHLRTKPRSYSFIDFFRDYLRSVDTA